MWIKTITKLLFWFTNDSILYRIWCSPRNGDGETWELVQTPREWCSCCLIVPRAWRAQTRRWTEKRDGGGGWENVGDGSTIRAIRIRERLTAPRITGNERAIQPMSDNSFENRAGQLNPIDPVYQRSLLREININSSRTRGYKILTMLGWKLYSV